MKTRDHEMKWQPAVAVRGRGLGRSFTGLFIDDYERNTALGVSRYDRQ
ncbi:MAG TPA: hypothetical protein VJT15_16390 [Pyrinomonadaceae bacterium]|nr:hypothetical protein [Pyrinomonadaceae bacterium]